MRTRPTILITGFGPFPGTPDNPSEYLVHAIDEGRVRHPHGVHIRTEILPTSWSKVSDLASRMHAEERPDIALHFGLADFTRGFRIERRARNRTRCEPDVDGDLPRRSYISRRGPTQLGTSLPVARIMLGLRALGMPASLSDDAGDYLCNLLFYRSLCSIGKTSSGKALFVHIPQLATFANEKELFCGAEAIIRICANHARVRGPRTMTQP